MKPRRFSWLLLLALFLGACGDSDEEEVVVPPKWQVEALAYATAPVLPGALPVIPQAAQPGYTWLLLQLEVENLTSADTRLIWFTDTFRYVTANGDTYSLKLNLPAIPGYLPTSYHPHQVQSGFLVFEVPEDSDFAAGTLSFTSSGQPTLEFPLRGLPSFTPPPLPEPPVPVPPEP